MMLDTQIEAYKNAPYNLRDKCLGHLQSLRKWTPNSPLLGRTPDELAKFFGVSTLAVRPRITELKKAGLIEDTGLRRQNRSGRKAVVWRAV